MSDSVVPAAPPDHTSEFAAKLLVLGLRASLAVSPRPTAWALRHLFAKSAAERGARQLTDAPADIVAVIDEPYDPNPDALLDMYMPGEAARSGTALPAVAQTHGGAFAGGSKDEIGGCSWLRSSSASRGRSARPAPQWHHRGAFGGEVPGQDPGAAEGGLQPHCRSSNIGPGPSSSGASERDRAWISAASAARSRRSCRPPAAVTRIASAVSRQFPGTGRSSRRWCRRRGAGLGQVRGGQRCGDPG